MTGSTLTVSNNTDEGIALANTATNSVSVKATDSVNAVAPAAAAATASLLSQQTALQNPAAVVGDKLVAATSTSDVSSIGLVGTSTVDMSNNTNTALGVANDVTNTLSASASASLGSGYGVTSASATVNGSTLNAVADYALNNSQAVSTNSSNVVPVVTASAATTIGVSDVPTTGQVTTSGVTITGNNTTAEADANRADNSLSLNGGATLAANGALTNSQTSPANVSSTMTISASFQEPGASGSTVSLTGNTGAAVANGNSATNALNATAGAQYTVASSAATGNGSATPSSNANFAVLNDQSDTGTVTATAGTALVGNAYSLPLNVTAVSNSALDNSSNRLQAQATGNAASNSITLAALPTGTASSALTSVQMTSGNVTAQLQNSTINITAGATGAAVSGSSLTVNGNTSAATAAGNTVTNIIGTAGAVFSHVH